MTNEQWKNKASKGRKMVRTSCSENKVLNPGQSKSKRIAEARPAALPQFEHPSVLQPETPLPQMRFPSLSEAEKLSGQIPYPPERSDLDRSIPWTATERVMLGNKEACKSLHALEGFSGYKQLRDMLLDPLLPFSEAIEDDETTREIESQIEFVKSLGFIDNAYLDNLIFYIEVLKLPVLSKGFLLPILDRYIRPDSRTSGIKQFQKLASGYFIYHVSRYENVSIQSAVRAMKAIFGINSGDLERCYRQYRRAYEKMGFDSRFCLFIDLICFYMLVFNPTPFEAVSSKIGNHPHTKKRHGMLVEGVRRFCNDIACRTLQEDKSAFNPAPPLPDDFLIPSCKSKISAFFDGDKRDFSIDEVACLLFTSFFHRFAPNISAAPGIL